MLDVAFRLKNGNNGNHYLSLTASDFGPRISYDLAHAPDLLMIATDGLGAVATWKHRPLSDTSAQTNTATDCDMPEPFYMAHHDDPDRFQGYVYFTSSMWTVARFDVSNGLGGATNKTCYRYQDAMLNNRGRGFQGFKVIVAEEQLPAAAGEDAAAAFPGCGGTCSPNNLRTRTEFHQEFPLTSKAKRVTVEVAKDGSPLSETTYWWHKVQGTSGAWVVYSSGVLEKKFELAPPGGAIPLAKQTTSISEVDVGSGETSRACVIVNGETPDPATPSALTPRDVITQDTRVLQPNDFTAWILGRPISRELLSDFISAPPSLDESCRVTGTGTRACSATAPTCPNFTACKMQRCKRQSIPGTRTLLRLPSGPSASCVRSSSQSGPSSKRPRRTSTTNSGT